MKNLSRAALAALLALTLVVAGCGGSNSDSHALYHCPMHPDYVSDKPGDCPICGMRLVPIEKNDPSTAKGGATGQGGSTAGGAATGVPSTSKQGDAVVYTCPMHPEVRSNEPGKCPICGMDLEPVKRPGEEGGSLPPGQPGATGHEGHQAGGKAGATKPGSVISLTADQARL
ncbi:MAG: hypothetical protein EHM24_26245, partial [Acidobacteria bacterium]